MKEARLKEAATNRGVVARFGAVILGGKSDEERSLGAKIVPQDGNGNGGRRISRWEVLSLPAREWNAPAS